MYLLCRYDKVKILLKEIQSCQYVACMNPTAGSFNITPRMQRHFATFAVQMPPPDIVRSIYLQILDGHLVSGGFEAEVTKMAAKLVDATIELHRLVSWPQHAAELPAQWQMPKFVVAGWPIVQDRLGLAEG